MFLASLDYHRCPFNKKKGNIMEEELAAKHIEHAQAHLAEATRLLGLAHLIQRAAGFAPAANNSPSTLRYIKFLEALLGSGKFGSYQQFFNVNNYPRDLSLLDKIAFVAPANTRFIGNHQFGKKLPTFSHAINAEMETWAKKCSACWNGTNTNSQQCNYLGCYGPGI